MYCYTLTVGDQPVVEDKIRISMREGLVTPVVYLGEETDGDEKTEVFIPIAQEWFNKMIELDQLELQNPHYQNLPALPPLSILHADLGDTKDNEGHLVSRPCNERDRRVLLLVQPPPDDDHVRYTGSYKKETFVDGRVRQSFPRMDEVTGIDLLGEVAGKMLIIMHPGARFRVGRRKSHPTGWHMYQLSTSGSRPRLQEFPRVVPGGIEFRGADWRPEAEEAA